MNTDIHLTGSGDSKADAKAVAAEQNRVAANVIRNTTVMVR